MRHRRGLTLNVGDKSLLVNADAENLALAVDTDDTVHLLVGGSGEDGVARDTVHVDALAGLDLVQVNEAELGDEVDDTVLLRDLHSDGEVVGRLWGEEDVDGLLRERRVGGLVADLDNMKLGAGAGTDGKAEELARGAGTVQLELSEGSSVTLDGLRDAPLDRVELHGALNLEGVRAWLAGSRVGRDTDEDEPLAVGGHAVVDDLVAIERGVAVEDLPC